MLDNNIKDLDVGVLVNNVGIAWLGIYHTQPVKSMFDLLHINCAGQLTFSRYFLNKWAAERSGKKCAIVDVSSINYAEPMLKLANYNASKAFNH